MTCFASADDAEAVFVGSGEAGMAYMGGGVGVEMEVESEVGMSPDAVPLRR